jgi:hypothetical protein
MDEMERDRDRGGEKRKGSKGVRESGIEKMRERERERGKGRERERVFCIVRL